MVEWVCRTLPYPDLVRNSNIVPVLYAAGVPPYKPIFPDPGSGEFRRLGDVAPWQAGYVDPRNPASPTINAPRLHEVVRVSEVVCGKGEKWRVVQKDVVAQLRRVVEFGSVLDGAYVTLESITLLNRDMMRAIADLSGGGAMEAMEEEVSFRDCSGAVDHLARLVDIYAGLVERRVGRGGRDPRRN